MAEHQEDPTPTPESTGSSDAPKEVIDAKGAAEAGSGSAPGDTGAETAPGDLASASPFGETPADGIDDAESEEQGRSMAAAIAAGTGAAVMAGGIAVAARDNRRRVLGVPIGRRSRFQRAAESVVDRVQEPARRLGSRFSRD